MTATAAKAIVNRMLGLSMVDLSAENVTLYVADLQDRAMAAGKIGPHDLVFATLMSNGSGRIGITNGLDFGEMGEPIAEALMAAERWLAEPRLRVVAGE